MNIRIEKKLANNKELNLIIVRNSKDFEVSFLDYGASIYSIAYPDKTGTMGKVAFSIKDFTNFVNSNLNYGRTIGPVAGRIKDAVATLNGETYNFVACEGVNSLHSGPANLGNHIWKFDIRSNASKTDVIFTIKHEHLFGGFPGNIDFKVIYTIYENKKELSIKMIGKPDRPAFINMTNHIYLNLNGGVDKIFNQELWINANKVAKMDDGLIIEGFENVPSYLDFTEPVKIGDKITNPKLLNATTNGMDHPFLLNVVDKNKPCATLYDPVSKRKMTMYSSYPAIICYCDNKPDGLENISGGHTDGNYGITFEGVYPTHITDAIVYTKEKPFAEIVKYKFN